MSYRPPNIWAPENGQALAIAAGIGTAVAALCALGLRKADWLSAAGQALSVLVACAALSVAVWAVQITQNVADEIKASGRNSGLISASSNLQQQWQLINALLLERPELVEAWEPADAAGCKRHFNARLGLCFYVLQILKQTRLYEQDDGISLPDQTHSTYYWAWRLTTDYADVWKWIKEKDRGFSPEILSCIEAWAVRYERRQTSEARTDSVDTEPSAI